MRRLAACLVTVWLLLGWAPSIYFSQTVQGGPDTGPQLYAVWIILLPMFGTCVIAALVALVMFYRWALEDTRHRRHEEEPQG